MHQLTTTSSHGDTRWFVQPEVAEQLLGADGFRFAEWQRAGLLETVKTGSHRTVYRLNLTSGCFYLKHYRVSDWKAVLQNLVRPPRALLEWRAAQWVAATGISTIETVAVGRTIRRGLAFDSFLACRAIENAEPLDIFITHRLQQLPAARRHIVRRNLTESLGRLVAALHRDRIIHRDLHAENILVRLEPDDSVRLWLIDLHAVTLCHRLSLRHIERNLALLNPALVHDLTAIDRVRFFRSYWRGLLSPGNSTSNPPKHLIPASGRSVSNRIAAFCRRDLIRIQHKRDRKWEHGNRRLIIIDTKSIRCRGLALLGREQLQSLRDNPDALFGFKTPLPGGAEGQLQSRRQLKRRDGGRSTHKQPLPPLSPKGKGSLETTSQIVTLKYGSDQIECRTQILERPPHNRWQEMWGGHSEVRHAWEMGHACLRRNIPTPRPLAIIDKDCGSKSRQYFLTENIPNAVTLDAFLQNDLSEVDTSLRSRQLARIAIQLAHELRHMHAEGLEYPSLGAASILIDRNQSGRHLWFAAPQNVRRLRRFGRQQDAHALTELIDSLRSHTSVRMTHYLRFLKRYLDDRFSAEWKTTWRGIHRGAKGASPVQRNRHRKQTSGIRPDNTIEHAPLNKSA
jgi:serine/threonine protein kinase